MNNKPQIKTVDFLPEVFRTETNREFLSATLDVLTSQPELNRVEGFIGNKYGYAVQATDRYVVEPTKMRADYQLSPSLTFLKPETTTARDFIDYPGLLKALANKNVPTDNPNDMFSNEFYSWDPFVSMDAIVNYSQYYWLPLGPDAVQVTTALTTDTILLSDIIGKTTYTTPNGVTLINGLKIIFNCATLPASYEGVEYYVEGVGTAIDLIPVKQMIVTENTGGAIYTGWDIDGWDDSTWSVSLYIPTTPDYITISRGSRDRNAWSRSNRWFSQNVIDTTIQFNGQVTKNPSNTQTRASRPIIEFNSNLSLWDSGNISKGFISFVDTTTADPLSTVVGQPTCLINGSITASAGSRVIFAAASDLAVRQTVYTVNLVPAGSGGSTVVALTAVPDLTIVDGCQVYNISGPGDYSGSAWRWSLTDGEFGFTEGWAQSQLKTAINQAPLFDIYDTGGVSIGRKSGSTFAGTKLFSYAPGVGANDPVLGFPISYSSVSNLGDINFDVNLNSDTYTYTSGTQTTTALISTGFVHYSPVYGTEVKRIGWVRAAAPSIQYQVFKFIIDSSSQQLGVTCDVLVATNTTWTATQVYVGGEFVNTAQYTVTTDTLYNTTTITLADQPAIGQEVVVLMLSDQTSPSAYYTIPANLQNNPFNTNITEVSVGDIRNHYTSIFMNAPDITGQQFGTNNYSNLGDLTPYGTAIIQNSASLALPMTFIRQPAYNIDNAIQYNSNEYIDYKNTVIDIAYREDYSVYQSPSAILDNIIFKITAAKSQDESFFWSDMLPSGSPYAVNSYDFNAQVTTAICPLSRVYDFTSANYYGVLVYLQRTVNQRVTYTQLIRDTDYTVSQTEPQLTVNYTILAGDKLVVKEYNQTYGSYIPNTPTKLGLYQRTIPKVITDTTYTTPTQFIVGHDGSYNKLYGNYTNGQLDDFRDIALLEFETRIYNNIKVSGAIPLTYTDLFPGEFRTTSYSHKELLTAYSVNFLAWVGTNRVDYKTQVYNQGNKFTYNYNKAGDQLQGQAPNASTPLQQGYWRGIYRWFYDTTNPAGAPWEMLGLVEKPSWWDSHYGVAPYTSGNTLMWQDIADGIVWNDGAPYVETSRIRPELLSVLPVDEQGNMLSPLETVVANFDELSFKRGWIVGDEGPAESSYLKSSSWPFDMMKLFAAFMPAKFYNLFADRDLYKYDTDLGQYLFNKRYHLVPSELTIYGNGTSKNSYINWIVDYINQVGTDGATDVTTTLKNIDVRLTYRLAGFSDKQYLKFLIERSTPTSNTPRLLIPDDSFDVLLYDNEPEDKITYSSVVVQRTKLGWTVWGNSLNSSYFDVTEPTPGPKEKITVNKTTIELSTTYALGSSTLVAYGTEFYSVQGVSEFLRNYGRRQVEQGVQFQNIDGGTVIDWTAMIKEFMAWAGQNWQTGSTISLNPNATLFNIYRAGVVVQPLTLQRDNFVLNQNMMPLQAQNMAVIRNNEEFTIKVLSVGDSIAYTNLNLSAIEHAVVFNNTTTFNDTIYQLTTGLRQNRVVMSGSKSAGWTGYINANGFILNEGDIQEWTVNGKYPKGQIVTYKNNYWSANELSEPQATFDYNQWTQVDYEQVKKGMLPNPSTMAYEATKFYNINESNLERDQDLLSYGLIGFRPRQYMVDAELSDISQVNIYLNMIPQKGTNLIANAFKSAELVQGRVDYDVIENWAIKNGDFGGVLNSNFVEMMLSQNYLSGNPSIIGFSSSTAQPTGVNQVVNIDNFINYGRQPTVANFLPPYLNDYTDERGLPTAGYVNINDVQFTAYTFDDLNLTPDVVATMYTSDYVWVANYQGSWTVLQPQSVGTSVVSVTNNLNGTINVVFADQHNLVADDMFAISFFDVAIDGYYTVNSVVNLNTVTVNSDLNKATASIQGLGIALKLVTRRFTQASDITNVPGTQFATRLSWVDSDDLGNWEVKAASTVYQASTDTEFSAPSLGTTVAYTASLGYLATNSNGNLYRNGVNTGLITNVTAMVATGDWVFCAPRVSNSVKTYKLVNNVLVLQQTIAVANPSVIAVSRDLNWLYVSNLTAHTVSVFMLSAGQYVLASTITGPAGEDFGSSLATSIDGSKLVIGAPARPETINSVLETDVGIAYIYSRASETFQADGTTATFTVSQSTGGRAIVYVDSVLVVPQSVSGTSVVLSTAPSIGSIVTIDYGTMTLQQTLLSSEPHDQARFGNSVATNSYGAEMMVGVPYEFSTALNTEGAVYRYTNSGQLYGTITSTPTLPVASTITVFIDGYKVVIPAGTATVQVIADIINNSEPTNVVASDVSGTLVISTITGTSNTPNDIIDLVGATAADLTALGITLYTNTQVIYNPDLGVYTGFGSTVAMNQESSLRDSLVVGAPTGTTLSATTFDFKDNLVSDDTIFDNGATSFNDSFAKIGAVYEFDYLPSNTESINNPGKYVFGQYCNIPNSAKNTIAGISDNARYGSALAFNDGTILVGSDTWYMNGNGIVEAFTATTAVSSWHTYRQPAQQVSVNKINNISIYDTETNTDLDFLDYIDPVQGKMLSAVETNIDYIGQTDPASYTTGVVWGADHIGKTWLDTTSLRMMNYNQADADGIADNVYNSSYWGVAFPGSTADIYTWVASTVEPINYSGAGFVVSFNDYTTAQILNRASDTLVSEYYFWVKNYTEVPTGKNLSPSVLSQYILNPVQSGVSFLAALTTNAVALFNCQQSIQSNSSALHIGYSTSDSGDILHQDWTLIQDGAYNSFLAGVPQSISEQPTAMYLKYLNSFMGAEVVNSTLLALPDSSLPTLVKYGTQFRPRQTMFIDRQQALQNYIDYANAILIEFPITETRTMFFLEQQGTTPTVYNTNDYWTLTNWWATGYSDNTKVVIEVATYTDLMTIGQAQLYTGSEGLFLSLQPGLVARVTKNGQGLSETYIYEDAITGWVRIGLENGTVQIKSTLYTSTTTALEIYYIVRWLTEEVFIDELEIENNNTLMMMFNLIQSQSIEQNNYLTWLNKTSLVDVSSVIRALRPYKKFQRDNQELVSGYLNEIKPYHVYIKSYALKYSAADNYVMDVTDFDLPAQFDFNAGTYITPQLIYGGAQSAEQYLPTSTIWDLPEYTKWFNNYGLSVSNSEVSYVPVTVLLSIDLTTTIAVAMTTASLTMVLTSLAKPVPAQGIVVIGGTQIAYTAVDYYSKTLTLTVAPPTDYAVGSQVTIVTPTVSASTYTLTLQNAASLPATGVIRIGSELIAYTQIDKATGVLSNVTRGVQGTAPAQHANGTEVYLQTQPVMIMSTGRGYTAQPQVTAVIDTTSTVSAWVSGTTYGYGDKVIYNSTGFVCTVYNSDTTFNGDNWQQIVIYTEPVIPATFTTTITDGRLTAVTLTNSGQGYATLPKFTVTASPITGSWTYVDADDSDIDLVTNQIYIKDHQFLTGDSVVFTGTRAQGFPLVDGDYYYVNKIDANTIALYLNYEDAINGWSTQNPAETLISSISGNELTLLGDMFVTGSQVKLVINSGLSTEQFYNYYAGRVYLDPTKQNIISLYNTLEDCQLDINRVTSLASAGDTIANVQETDATRIKFDVGSSGTISVSAVLAAYTNEQPVREMKIGMKFDRTSYTYSATDINAIWRIQNQYEPTADMPGFKLNDYTQLMSGTKSPDVKLIDPGFDFDRSYVFLTTNVNIAQNTIALSEAIYSPTYTPTIVGNPTTPPYKRTVEAINPAPPNISALFANPVQMLFIESPFNEAYSTTFGLSNKGSYWFKAVSSTQVAAYNTQNDAINNTNRISLVSQTPGQLFAVSYDSVVVAGDDYQYNIISEPFEFGYGPEELVPGVVTDNINVTVTSKPGSTWSPTTTGIGLQNGPLLAHTGFNMVKFTATPKTIKLRDGTVLANAIDFSQAAPNPNSIAIYADGQLYDANAVGGNIRRVVETAFTVDWVNQVIVITDTLIASSLLYITVYEYGNGNQLVRSNSTIYAMSTVDNPVPHTEILLDVPFTSSTFTRAGVTFNVEGITLPTAANYWETVAVFANGERLQYNDPAYPVIPNVTPSTIKFTVEPQRTFDPDNDPYNPAKLVFDGLYDPTVDYVSFVATADLNSISGISVPETQWFTNQVGVNFTLDLSGFLGDDNINTTPENIILEINGQRYAGSAPTIIGFTATNNYLAYPAPVYGLSDFNPLNLVVRVNGVEIPSSTATWQPSYDAATLLPGAFDADFGLDWGYFDDGTPFDNKTMLAVVFEPAYLATFAGQQFSIEYDAASVPPVFSVTANPGLVGGVMTVLVPVIATDVISVTTFNRTTQQSLVTQTITDATTSLIVGVTEIVTQVTTVTTSDYHNLEPHDYVMINGNATPDLEGNYYYVDVISQFTVALYYDYNLADPVQLSNTGPLIPGKKSYIQAINVNDQPSDPCLLAIDQPIFSLYDEDRLWVTLIRKQTGLPDLRDYIAPQKLMIVNNTLIVLEVIDPSDVIVLTSMVPSASPDQTRLRINLDKYNGATGQGGWGTAGWDSTGWSSGQQQSSAPETITTTVGDYDTTPWSILPWSSSLSTSTTLPATISGYLPSVYRENQQSRTYLTQTMTTTLQPSDQFTVANPLRLIDLSVFKNKTIVNGTISGVSTNYITIIGVTAVAVTSVTVVATASGIDVTDFIVEVINSNSIRLVFSTSPAGLAVDISLAIGNTVLIQGEEIGFTSIDLATGVVSGLKRGMNTTIVNEQLNKNSVVQGVQQSDRLNAGYYNNIWYGDIADTIPLQLTVTPPADFLNTVS